MTASRTLRAAGLVAAAVIASAVVAAPGVAGQAAPAGPESRTAVTRRVTVTVRGTDLESTPVTEAEVRLVPRAAGPELEISTAVESEKPGVYRAEARTDVAYAVTVVATGYRRGSVTLPPGRSTHVTVDLVPAPFPLPELVARAEAGDAAGHRIDWSADPLSGATVGEWLGSLPGLEVRGRGAGGPEVVTLRGSRPEAVLVTLDGIPLTDPLTGATDISLIPTWTLASGTARPGASPGGWGGSAGQVALRSRRDADGLKGRLALGSYGHTGVDLAASESGSAGWLSATGRLERSANDYPFRNRILPDRPRERRRNADRSGAHATVAAGLRGLPLSVIGRLDVVERGTPGRMGTALWDLARWRDLSGILAARLGGEEDARLDAAWSVRHQKYSDARVGRDERLRAESFRLSGVWPVPGVEGWELRGHAAHERVTGEVIQGPADRPTGGLATSYAIGDPAGVRVTPELAADAARGVVALSPSVRIDAPLSSGWRVRARAGRAYRLPTFADLYLSSSYAARPNPDLAPERVRLDAELGLEWRPDGGRLWVRSSAYLRRTDDPIVWLPSSTAVWSPRNAGQLTALGGELEARWALAPGWRLEGWAHAGRSRVRFGSNVTPMPYQPALSALLAIERRAGPSGFRGVIRYTGERRTSLAGPHQLPAYTEIDLRGRRSIDVVGLALDLDLAILNVFDARYERVELFPEPGRRFELRVGFRMGPSAPDGGALAGEPTSHQGGKE